MYRVTGVAAAKGVDYLCSACIEDLYRKGELDRVELPRTQGAPEAWLRNWEAKLTAGPLHRSGLPPYIWGEILGRALDAAIAKASLQAEAMAAELVAPDPMATLLARVEALEARLAAGTPTPD